MRPSRRAPDELRAVSLERGVVKYAEGSCMVKFGDTHVLVTATLEERLPPWLKGQGARRGPGRIRQAAPGPPGAPPPRGVRRQAKRPHRRNPAPDRPLLARDARPRGTRRTPDYGRLRRAAGRWRHPHRLDHWRMGGSGRLHWLDENPQYDQGQRAARQRGRDLLRRLWRPAGPDPRFPP